MKGKAWLKLYVLQREQWLERWNLLPELRLHKRTTSPRSLYRPVVSSALTAIHICLWVEVQTPYFHRNIFHFIFALSLDASAPGGIYYTYTDYCASTTWYGSCQTGYTYYGGGGGGIGFCIEFIYFRTFIYRGNTYYVGGGGVIGWSWPSWTNQIYIRITTPEINT